MKQPDLLAGACPAGLFRRLAAMLYDGLLILALLMSTLTILVALTNQAVAPRHVVGLVLLESFAFFAFFWIFRGQTLGMLAWKLIIVSTSGYRITLTQALLRYATALFALACFGLGYLWMLIDPERRTWPDLASDTRILCLPRRRR